MADFDPTFGGKLIVGIGAQSDKDTAAGGLTYLYCKPAGLLPKTSFGYAREKFAGGGRVAPSFKRTGDGNTKSKLVAAWSPGLSDILFATSGIGAQLGVPDYVTLEFNLVGAAKWTSVGAMASMFKLTGKKSQGFWQIEIDYEALHPGDIGAAPGTAPAVSGTFAPLMWGDFAAAALLNGATGVRRVGQVDIEVNHNITSYPGNNGSAFPSDLIPTDPDVKLTMEMLFSSLLAYQQFANTAQAAGQIILPIGAHTVTLSNMEYMTNDPDAGDLNKPSIEKITAESIPGSPTAQLLAVA